MFIKALKEQAGKEPTDKDLVNYIEKNIQNLDVKMQTAVIMVVKE